METYPNMKMEKLHLCAVCAENDVGEVSPGQQVNGGVDKKKQQAVLQKVEHLPFIMLREKDEADLVGPFRGIGVLSTGQPISAGNAPAPCPAKVSFWEWSP